MGGMCGRMTGASRRRHRGAASATYGDAESDTQRASGLWSGRWDAVRWVDFGLALET
jgi:hypothetical protein